MISNKAISTILTTPIYQSHNVSRGVICIHQRVKKVATHSAYSHFLLITIQHYLIKYKRTKQIFVNNILILLLQFIKVMIYFNKLIDICINR